MTDKERHARAIVYALRERGFTAYFAGGCVRDKLLGVEPKDYDVATDAPATEVMRLFPQTVPVGVQFGVVLVLYAGTQVEVATFRSDGVYVDGRHPTKVRFSNAHDDAQRRDFTINGMFYDPSTEQVIDYVKGRQDLAAGVIRAIGDPYARFAEDRLRMLRGVRLAARLGFAIEPETFAATQDLAPTIVDMAWERIGDEISKILTDGGAQRAFALLTESRLLPVILPEIEAMRGVEQSPDFHPEGDVFVHTLLLLAKLDHPTETLALGALLHDVAKPVCRAQGDKRITFYGHCETGAEMAIDICQRLKRSRETWERVAYLVKNHLRLISAPQMRASTLKRFLREDGIEELLELARIDALSSSGDLGPYEFCRQQLAKLGPEQIAPPRLLTGRDLISLGLQPGPRFKEILDAVDDAQLEGQLLTHDDALSWVRQQYGI
ncbi:MAG: CCA tRNA nucleotidyltransferase [Deltaproteobacteria bacterium]|nr:CCA tRNA nucleotidyltransferase [Deltaproteobacteria bacterium]